MRTFLPEIHKIYIFLKFNLWLSFFQPRFCGARMKDHKIGPSSHPRRKPCFGVRKHKVYLSWQTFCTIFILCFRFFLQNILYIMRWKGKLLLHVHINLCFLLIRYIIHRVSNLSLPSTCITHSTWNIHTIHACLIHIHTSKLIVLTPTHSYEFTLGGKYVTVLLKLAMKKEKIITIL